MKRLQIESRSEEEDSKSKKRLQIESRSEEKDSKSKVSLKKKTPNQKSLSIKEAEARLRKELFNVCQWEMFTRNNFFVTSTHIGHN